MLRGPLKRYRRFDLWFGDGFCIPTRRLPEFRLPWGYGKRLGIPTRSWGDPSCAQRSERRGGPAGLIRTTVRTKSPLFPTRIVTLCTKPIRSTARRCVSQISTLPCPRAISRTPKRRILLTRPSPTHWPKATGRSACGERSAIAAYGFIRTVPVRDLADHWSTPVDPLPRVGGGIPPGTLLTHAKRTLYGALGAITAVPTATCPWSH